jgi:hypothetical protein
MSQVSKKISCTSKTEKACNRLKSCIYVNGTKRQYCRTKKAQVKKVVAKKTPVKKASPKTKPLSIKKSPRPPPPNYPPPKLKEPKKKEVAKNKLPKKEIESNNEIDIFIKKKLKNKQTLWNASKTNIFLGLLYIFKKHQAITCNPIIKQNSLTKKYSIQGYQDYQIFYAPINPSVLKGLNNDEITTKKLQGAYKLFLIRDDFFDILKKCKLSGKRFIICLLYINFIDTAHQNVIIFDLEKNTCERFEPYGMLFHKFQTVSFETMLEDALDKEMKAYVKLFDKTMTYLPPSKFCPERSFQFYNDYYGSEYYNDPSGFCSIWSLWWTDLRLSNPDIPQSKLIDFSKNKIKKTDLSFKQFIRNYANFIQNNRKQVLKDIKLSEEMTKTIIKKKLKFSQRDQFLDAILDSLDF